MKRSPLDTFLTVLENHPEPAAWSALKELGDFYLEQYHKLNDSGAAGVKEQYEKWAPRREELLARAEDNPRRKNQTEAFYHALEVVYSKHRGVIRQMLAKEREAGVTPPSARVALEQYEKEQEAGTADGAGGGWVEEVLRYMYDEQEVPL